MDTQPLAELFSHYNDYRLWQDTNLIQNKNSPAIFRRNAVLLEQYSQTSMICSQYALYPRALSIHNLLTLKGEDSLKHKSQALHCVLISSYLCSCMNQAGFWSQLPAFLSWSHGYESYWNVACKVQREKNVVYPFVTTNPLERHFSLAFQM